jgi:hypothetical protein
MRVIDSISRKYPVMPFRNGPSSATAAASLENFTIQQRHPSCELIEVGIPKSVYFFNIWKIK